MPAIANSKILIMATHGFEESELFKPLEELKARGDTLRVAAPEAGEIRAGGTKTGVSRCRSTSPSRR